jgi:hypothetical protein
MEENDDRLIFRGYPVMLWLFGLLALGFTVMSALQEPAQLIGSFRSIGGNVLAAWHRCVQSGDDDS